MGAEAHPELVHVVAADWIAWRSVETVEGLAVFDSVLSVVGERARVEAVYGPQEETGASRVSNQSGVAVTTTAEFEG